MTTNLPFNTFVTTLPVANTPSMSGDMLAIVQNGSTKNLNITGLLLTARQKQNVATSAINYTLVATDSGTYFDNSGATGEVDFTLMTLTAGFWAGFTVMASQTLKILAPAGATLNMGTASGTSLVSSLPYSFVSLFAPHGATTQWVVDRIIGTWTLS